MGWSLLPIALRPFKIYCSSLSITSQLVVFLWQTIEIGPLGHVRIVEALQNFVQKCDPFDVLCSCSYVISCVVFGGGPCKLLTTIQMKYVLLCDDQNPEF